MFFSTSISPYLNLFLKVEGIGFFSGFNPPKISFTYIFATLKGVPFKLSSVKSIPSISSISRTFSCITLIFSSSEISKASSLIGLSELELR